MTVFRGRDAVVSFLQDVDDELSQDVAVYLVGGSAMTAHSLKDQTKDIDLVLGVSTEFEHLRDALLEMGFDIDSEPTAAFDDVGRTLQLSSDQHVVACIGKGCSIVELERSHTLVLRSIPT